MLDALTLAAGLVLLIVAAYMLVDGSVSIAERLGVSPLVIGLTVVSFGTSMPELVVTLVAGLQNKPDLAIGNVLGSNIANVLVVLGLAAIIRPLPVRDSTVVSEVPFSLAATLLVGFLANAALFSTYHELSISRLDGAILLSFFLLFMLYIYKMSQVSGTHTQAEDRSNPLSMPGAVLYIAVGIVGLYFGGELTVSGAVSVATSLGIDDAVIGLTVIAIGTSTPEIVASAVAAYRNQVDIAVGNVVGSNIFNLLWILGVTSSVVELPFDVISNTDLVIVIASSALIILAMISSRNGTITRAHGVLFVGLYAIYTAYIVYR